MATHPISFTISGTTVKNIFYKKTMSEDIHPISHQSNGDVHFTADKKLRMHQMTSRMNATTLKLCLWNNLNRAIQLKLRVLLCRPQRAFFCSVFLIKTGSRRQTCNYYFHFYFNLSLILVHVIFESWKHLEKKSITRALLPSLIFRFRLFGWFKSNVLQLSSDMMNYRRENSS